MAKIHDARHSQGADNSEQHGGYACPNGTPCSLRLVHPFERQDEQGSRGQISELNQAAHLGLVSSLFLNIFNMRSVIRKPLTMFVTDAAMATRPSK